LPLSERIIFQPYRRGKRGDVIAGGAVICRTVEEAQRRADKAMTSGGGIGAHIVRIAVDVELGDYGEPEYLAIMGIVPDFV
jgi:hypothetical protein